MKQQRQDRTTPAEQRDFSLRHECHLLIEQMESSGLADVYQFLADAYEHYRPTEVSAPLLPETRTRDATLGARTISQPFTIESDGLDLRRNWPPPELPRAVRLQVYPDRTGWTTDESCPSKIVRNRVRMTDAVRSALLRAGAIIEPETVPNAPADIPSWRVQLGREMPRGIVAKMVHTAEAGSLLTLRMDDESVADTDTDAEGDYWVQLDWTPCPTCGAPLVWYEAGYVPGYRVCAAPPFHHVLALGWQ